MNGVKRVLIVGMTNNYGGLESVIMNIYRNIDRSKIQFDFLASKTGIACEDEIKSLGGEIFKLKTRRRNLIKNKKEIDNFFKNNVSKYVAVWYHACALSNLMVVKSAKKYHAQRIILHSHSSHNLKGVISGIFHFFNKLLVPKIATDYWSCGELASKWFYSKKLIQSNKHKIINNAINLENFRFNEQTRNKLQEELNIHNSFVLGHVGRFRKEKNHEFLIQVFEKIKKEKPNSKLMLLGSGEDFEKVKQQVKDLSLENDVLMLGTKQDIYNYYQAMDCFVFPSLYEGFPVSLIEAQTSGLSIFVADTVTQKTKIIDEAYFLSLQNSADEWANFILKNYKKINRSQQFEKVEHAGFNIKAVVKEIADDLLKEGK